MSDVLTQSRMEDAVAAANDFLVFERGVELDGADVHQDTLRHVESVQERAEALLTQMPSSKHPGLYSPLNKLNADQFGEATTVLPDHYVLVHSSSVDPNSPPAFYPGVVSEDGVKTGTLRIHVYRTPFHFQERVGDGVDMMLSAAGQSETAGVGQHGKTSSDGLEAEHFATLLAAGSDRSVQNAWGNGVHINHDWRQNPGTSVTTEVSRRLFSADDPQSTIQLTSDDVKYGHSMLFWHESMRDEQGRPLTATREKALLVFQGLGFEALKTTNPSGIEDVKRMIA